MIEQCKICGGLYASGQPEMIAGTPCQCRLGAVPCSVVRKPHKCPICDGSGLTLRPPWVAGDSPGWASTTVQTYPCKACSGSGVLWEPQYSPLNAKDQATDGAHNQNQPTKSK